jgi:hypothetical protein
VSSVHGPVDTTIDGPVGVSARLGLVVLLVAAVLASVARPADATQVNPPGVRTCGADLVLVLDASSSIRGLGGASDRNGAADDVVAAAVAFLDSVSDTGARVAIVSYDAKAIVQTDFMLVNGGSMAAGGALSIALGDPGGSTGPVPANATGYSGHVRDGQGTNWEAALDEARRLVERSRDGGSASVVHITDGEPTWHVRADGSSTGLGTPLEHLGNAVVPADLIKSAGAHIYAVGIGPARDNVDALVATSGPDVYDQSDLSDILDPVADDVLLVSDPSRLEQSLSRFAQAACGASLTVRVVTGGDAGGPFSAAAGWVASSAPGSTRGYDWVLPDTGPAMSKTAATGGDGEARFAWAVTDDDAWVSTVAVEVPLQDGYRVVDGTCRRDGDDEEAVAWGAGAFDVEVGPTDTVTCVLRAVESVDGPDLTVLLSAVAGLESPCPGRDPLVVAAEHPITYCAEIGNPTDRIVSDLTATVSGIGWEPDVPAELAPGESVMAMVSVPATDDVAAVLSATGTIDQKVTVDGTDATDVTVVRPGLVLEKTVDEESVTAGTTVTYELVVRNVGSVALDEVEVADPDCGAISGPEKSNDDGDEYLDFGEVWTYTCSAIITEDLINVARASAWAVDRVGERIPGGSVQARSNATVTVTAEVEGSSQTQTATGSGTSTQILRMPQTGAEILGTAAGALGLIGLGLLLMAARRRRG